MKQTPRSLAHTYSFKENTLNGFGVAVSAMRM
jgi:hypothetical protein